MSQTAVPCPVCGADTLAAGVMAGRYRRTLFHLHHCPACRCSFVANPWTEYERIYNEAYYCGRGADPRVDYLDSLEHPEQTVQLYEWRGVLSAVRSLVSLSSATTWLDYGCGNGGLVRYCRGRQPGRIVGFEEGWIKERAVAAGIELVSREELAARRGSFDIVTAIEVIEHTVQPVEFLREIRAVLKPGGLLFVTTANARPFRGRLLQWGYLVPEVHVTFFEPETLARALTLAGFRAERRAHICGYHDIIRYKILKRLNVRRRSLVERLLPWDILARAADFRLGVSAQPVGWAVE